jgi:selenocysteine-specific elongation factor
VQLDPGQLAVRAALAAALATGGTTALTDAQIAGLGADRRMLAALVRLGDLVTIAPGLHLGRQALEGAVAALRQAFPAGRPFTAAEAKEAMGTTRRTAIPLLEYLDRDGVTVRTGDHRRLASR